jgi:allantoin racemase
MKIALINPNTNPKTTEIMRQIAKRNAPVGVKVVGFTAPYGAPLITNAAALADAAQAVAALRDQLAGYDGVIVAAFGDPGLEHLREQLPCPVVGIAEASMRVAGADGRRFAVATTTPDLVAAIALRATQGGHMNFAGTWLTPGDPLAIMANPAGLVDALYAACMAAIAEGCAEAIIIGGGPLAFAADALRDRLPVPVIAPIPEAIHLLHARIKEVL